MHITMGTFAKQQGNDSSENPANKKFRGTFFPHYSYPSKKCITSIKKYKSKAQPFPEKYLILPKEKLLCSL